MLASGQQHQLAPFEFEGDDLQSIFDDSARDLQASSSDWGLDFADTAAAYLADFASAPIVEEDSLLPTDTGGREKKADPGDLGGSV